MTAKFSSRELLTPAQVALAFAVDVKTVNRWADLGKFPPGTVIRTLGNQRRFDADVVRALLNGESGGQS